MVIGKDNKGTLSENEKGSWLETDSPYDYLLLSIPVLIICAMLAGLLAVTPEVATYILAASSLQKIAHSQLSDPIVIPTKLICPSLQARFVIAYRVDSCSTTR